MTKKVTLKNLTIEKLAALISEKLHAYNIDCVLVGGACVSIYTHNKYQSYDLDFVTYENMKKVTNVMKELGFQKRDKYFVHPDSEYFIEFVAPPVAVGNEPIHTFEYRKVNHGTIKMLTPTDCVKDRLASFYHWDDKQSLDQALMICKELLKAVDLEEIKRWSMKEEQTSKFQQFFKALQKH